MADSDSSSEDTGCPPSKRKSLTGAASYKLDDVGFLAKQKASQLLQEGDISASKFSSFFSAVRMFFSYATEYLLKWCPMKEDLLKSVVCSLLEWTNFFFF